MLLIKSIIGNYSN